MQSIIVQQPAEPRQLVLLTHGVGSVPQSMLGTAAWFAARYPQAMIVSVASPCPSELGNGLQWFSVRGVTEENRQARIDDAMPRFLEAIAHWQAQAGVDATDTILAGFSQGAIMALESTRLAHAPAATIVAIAGRYANLPDTRPAAAIHLLHGSADGVMPVALAQAAHARLLQLGAAVTLDIAEGIGHQPDVMMLDALGRHLPRSMNLV
ncbi:esterase [Herbaspirillum sp. alder98]|uniref:esterase n=1 Tax=Herbaspirillum sp. alder98 TaxID=2913096 RepID=UPI001CD86FDF|nr:esterase [Herbaspirillum sp. alder98]MCA1324878.1 esterase [Herbaspirillum sp. alder98]